MHITTNAKMYICDKYFIIILNIIIVNNSKHETMSLKVVQLENCKKVRFCLTCLKTITQAFEFTKSHISKLSTNNLRACRNLHKGTKSKQTQK